jgi:hypothetical protein
MIFRHDAGDLLTIERMRTLENFRLVFQPKFCFGPNCFGFFSAGPLACRPCWLEAQLLTQVHKKIKGQGHCTGEQLSAAGPCRVVAWPTRNHGAPVSPTGRGHFLSQAAVLSHMAASSVSQPTWASGYPN